MGTSSSELLLETDASAACIPAWCDQSSMRSGAGVLRVWNCPLCSDNARMGRALKWLIGAALLGVLALAGVAASLQFWINSPDFRGRVAREASAAAGVTVELGGLSLDLWPLPA